MSYQYSNSYSNPEWDSEYDSTWEDDEGYQEMKSKPKRAKQFNSWGRPRNRAAADLKRYRHGYPDPMPNLQFYRNKIPFQPNGVYIDYLHYHWRTDYYTLEMNHSYIQWLFPLREPGVNHLATPLTGDELQEMKKDEDVRRRFLESYKLMLGFYGIQLVDEATGKVFRASNWEERFYNLDNHSHNNLRITRILKCLGEMGYEHYQAPLVRFFLEETLCHNNLTNVKQSVLDYFMFTVKNKAERKELVLFAWDQYEPKSRFIWGPLEVLRKLRPPSPPPSPKMKPQKQRGMNNWGENDKENGNKPEKNDGNGHDMKDPGRDDGDDHLDMKEPGRVDGHDHLDMKVSGRDDGDDHLDMKVSGRDDGHDHLDMKVPGRDDGHDHLDMKVPGRNDGHDHLDMKVSGRDDGDDHLDMKEPGGNDGDDHLDMKVSGMDDGDIHLDMKEPMRDDQDDDNKTHPETKDRFEGLVKISSEEESKNVSKNDKNNDNAINTTDSKGFNNNTCGGELSRQTEIKGEALKLSIGKVEDNVEHSNENECKDQYEGETNKPRKKDNKDQYEGNPNEPVWSQSDIGNPNEPVGCQGAIGNPNEPVGCQGGIDSQNENTRRHCNKNSDDNQHTADLISFEDLNNDSVAAEEGNRSPQTEQLQTEKKDLASFECEKPLTDDTKSSLEALTENINQTIKHNQEKDAISVGNVGTTVDDQGPEKSSYGKDDIGTPTENLHMGDIGTEDKASQSKTDLDKENMGKTQRTSIEAMGKGEAEDKEAVDPAVRSKNKKKGKNKKAK